MEKKYVAYYRVSTRAQESSGLGLEAQRQAVLHFIRRNGNRIVAEYTETESGGRDDRPELQKAIQRAKEEGATLVIAKLDRLSRNLTFISHLMDSRVKFVAADMPEASNDNPYDNGHTHDAGGTQAVPSDQIAVQPSSDQDETQDSAKIEMGFLTIKTSPKTKVYVEREYVGETPVTDMELSPGKYSIILLNKKARVEKKIKIKIRPQEVTALQYIF